MDKINFLYVIDYEYDSCSCRGECEPDDYCRCSTYVGLRVEPLTEKHIRGAISLFIERWKIKGDFMTYCVDRIFRFFRGFDRANWTVNASSGWYGEEVNDLTFDKEEEFKKIVMEFLEMSPNERIEALMTLEYGSIPPSLLGLDWSLKVIKPEKIKFKDSVDSDIENMRSLKQRDSVYDHYSGIIGLCVERNGFFSIVDGCHRFRAKHTQAELPFLVGTLK